jgi:hypothetical protein
MWTLTHSFPYPSLKTVFSFLGNPKGDCLARNPGLMASTQFRWFSMFGMMHERFWPLILLFFAMPYSVATRSQHHAHIQNKFDVEDSIFFDNTF